jgi:hypothetical protein
MKKLVVDDRLAFGALDVEECLVLLRWEVVGRLAVAAPGQAPTVVPVNFVVQDDTIVFRTGSGEKLDLLKDRPVSLQVDRFDWYRRLGWSVLVKGMAHEIDPAEIDDIDFEPWVPGHKAHVVRIVPSEITGRRLELSLSPLDGRGYL